ncbi:MAG: hypothetical protein AVDCRST_MAG96-771 [uncultured Segetibacter sp.]|uniref:Paraquat-inducible protein A n=1 Tax=uncultured Segetibacter sp. TaxID=481133 RepID=A0A6J4RM02_9BACT|nr:MAG: hypothetical protein AVDCRST_MAG96-771 [uncultured Segetibacter sp.]
MTTEEKPKRTNKFGWRHLLLILGMTGLLCAEGYFGYQLHKLSDQQEELKGDYASVNDITMGLFSIEQWHDKITGIINNQVRHFTLSRKQNRELQIEVEQIIVALINKAEALLNKPARTFVGNLKKFAVKTVVDTDDIKTQAPRFAKTIIAKVNNPANKRKLSTVAMSKLTAMEHSPYFDSAVTANDSITAKVYHKYNVTTSQQLNTKLSASLGSIRTSTYNYSFAMLACIITVLMLWWIFRRSVELHATLFVMSLLFAFILLAVGLSASMIEVDARIKSLDFMLLGEHVVFKDQVLFFQSKSIMDVVAVLIKQPEINSVLVGILILVFSILFPVMKLSSTGIHLLGKKKLAENKIIKYFAFQSGKWSMADVIVIAILMAYIGLNGLLQSQLESLNISSNFLTIITTNNTALQPGYIIFISFVLYGLVLSTILKFITPHNKH